jgi:hypothetical protein
MDTGFKDIVFRIKGIVPLLLHNGLLSDPLDPRSIALKKAVKANTKAKTEASALEMSRIEFLGGLYVDDDGAPCIPGEVLEACIRTGAKQSKDGKAVQAGLFCDGNSPIIYDGPKTADELWDCGAQTGDGGFMTGRRFVDRRRVRVGQAAVMRTRPIFREWELEFTASYDPIILNRDSVVDFLTAAGRCGLCEMRPRFGRFEIVKAF